MCSRTVQCKPWPSTGSSNVNATVLLPAGHSRRWRVPVTLASGLFNLMRNLGGAIGIAVCGTLLNDRTNVHFVHLSEHLTAGNRHRVLSLQRFLGM
jgi:hypothetical protein